LQEEQHGGFAGEIALRREAGYRNTQKMLEERPWLQAHDPLGGVLMYGPPPVGVAMA